jgi:parvulin-like peptidyl-prolyl isomerase
MKSTSLTLWALPLAAAFAGCSSQPKPQPLTPQAFISPRENASTTSDNPNTGGGAAGDNARPSIQLPANEVTNTIDQALGRPVAPKVPANRDTPGAQPRIADVVANEVKPITGGSGTAVPASATTGESSLPPIGASSGQYMTVGGVVAEVNGTPIYADKVLAYNDFIFRTKAKQLDQRNFQTQALKDIQKTIRELIQGELEYAAAQRNLDPDDRHLADAATMYWRVQKITQAGGSLELARRAALADPKNPMDFDEMTIEQNRLELIRIFYTKKIYPKIQVTAADIREYYDHNVDKEFTINEQIKFRLIKVDIDKTSKEANKKELAQAKALGLWKRAKAGEDFAAMAARENDEQLFAGKEPFDIAPKSFSIAPVREALSKLKVNEVSEILEDSKAFYIVKIENRVEGRIRPFEEQAVQDEIRFKLKSQQFRALREEVQQNLVKDATIRSDPPDGPPQLALIALDMAMQRYAQYAKAK